LDSCGSVSLAHSKYLSNIKYCSQYNIPIVTLNGIGGSTLPITKAGVLTHVTPQRKLIKFLCYVYVFDTPIGKTQEMILLGLKTLVESNIDIRHHMKLSVQGLTKMVRFLDMESQNNIHRRHVDLFHHDVDDINSLCNESAVDYYRGTSVFEECVNDVFMTEIQLKNIVERLQSEEKDTKTDGDETMVKDGVRMV
jgi:hypothetical protein